MPKMRCRTSFILRLVICLFLLHIGLSHSAWFGEVKESNTAKAISDRLKPVGQVSIEGAAAASVKVAVAPGDIGKHRYEVSCKVCHAAGIAGAPKFKAADWKPRMKVGIAALLASAIKGKGGMPPKGTCMSCTDDELKAAIEHMLPN